MVTLHELSFLPLRVTDLQSAGRGNSQNGNSTRTLNTVFQSSLSVKCCYQNYIETHALRTFTVEYPEHIVPSGFSVCFNIVAGYVSSDIVQVSAIYP